MSYSEFNVPRNCLGFHKSKQALTLTRGLICITPTAQK